MATREATPSTLSSVVSASASGDTIILQAGQYTSFPIKSGVIYQAFDWAAGRVVSGTTGHNGANMGVRVTVAMSTSANNVTYRGIWHDMRDATASFTNAAVITGNFITYEDCATNYRPSNGNRMIGITLGGCNTSPGYSNTQGACTGFRFLRGRHNAAGKINNAHDHCFYFRNTKAHSGAAFGFLIEDTIMNDGGWYPCHLYINPRDGIIRRCVIYRGGKAITFSGETTSTNSTICASGAANSITVENCIISDKYGSGGYLIEEWFASGAAQYAGNNIVRNNLIMIGSGTSGRIQPGTQSITFSNNADSTAASPGYVSPSTGDFRLQSGSPGVGYGPAQIQPGGTPPPPTVNPITGLTATPGDGQITLNWTNPSSFQSIVVRRATGTYPSSPTSGTSVYNGTGTSVVDTGLTNSTQYYYSVWATDGTNYSTAAQATATPTAPATDPAPGQEKFGKIEVGTNWRGMSVDYKRSSVFTAPAGKQITSIWVRMRGTGTSTVTQSIRAFAYNHSTGALLGSSTTRSIAENLSEQWIQFNFSSPVVLPAGGGQIRLGLHSGAYSGTKTGDVQFVSSVVANALLHGSDTFSDGLDATWTSPLLDTYEMTIFAIIENAPGVTVNPVTNLTATPGDQKVTLSWTNPTAGTFDAIIVKRATGGYPATPADGTEVYNAIPPVPPSEPTGEVYDNVVTGQDTIWSIAFDPSGKMWWTERPGRVKFLDGTTIRTALTLSGTESLSAEEGLQGLAFDPNFSTNNFVYIYYSLGSSSTSITNRLARYTFNSSTNTLTNPLILIDNIPGYQFHVGGRIKFGPDGFLYVCVGDAANNGSSDAVRAQDDNSLAGKILRVRKEDGTAAAGNPISGNRLYSKGNRNPQGLAWHPISGDLWSTEHGPTGGGGDANDEVNLILPGGNYGWPKYYGNNLLNSNSWAQSLSITTADVILPKLSSGSSTWAPAGCCFYSGTKLASEWKDKLLWTGLGFNTGDGKSIYRLPVTGVDFRSVGTLERKFQNTYGRLRDIVEGPDEFLYFSTSNRDGRGSPASNDDRIIRIRATVDSGGAYTTTIDDTGLTNGVEYFYSVWAKSGTTYSVVKQVSAIPNGPVTTDPAPGQEKFGNISLGTTWRGMGPDVKRASVFTMPAGKQIKAIWVRMRGAGTGSATQPTRAFAYNDTTGDLLGASNVQNLSESLTEQWVAFTFSTPAVGPAAGGPVRLGLHTGAWSGTRTGDVQWSAAVVTDALKFASDLFSDGTDAVFGTVGLDQYEMSIFAIIENTSTQGTPLIANNFTATVNSDGTISLSSGIPSDLNRSSAIITRRYIQPTDNSSTSASPTVVFNQQVGTSSQTITLTDSPPKSGTYWYDIYMVGSGGSTRRSASVYPVQLIKSPISGTIGVSGSTVTGSIEVPSDDPETPVAGVTLGRKSLKVFRKNSPWTSNDTTSATLVQSLEGI